MTRLLRLGVTAAAVASGVSAGRSLLRVGYAIGRLEAEPNDEDSCGYCGVPPDHWPWCPLFPAEFPVEAAFTTLAEAWTEGHEAAIKHLAEGVSTPNPYLQLTEGGA